MTYSLITCGRGTGSWFDGGWIKYVINVIVIVIIVIIIIIIIGCAFHKQKGERGVLK